MDQSTHDVRRANWLNIVNQCQSRPADMSVKRKRQTMRLLLK